MFMSDGSTQRTAEIRNIFIISLAGLCGRRGGFMVSALDPLASGPGARFSKLPTGPLRCFGFPFQMRVSEGLKTVQ